MQSSLHYSETYSGQ